MIELDHTIGPSHTAVESARRLAELLDVPWAPAAPLGPFSPVYVNEGLTLDFIQTDEDFPIYHFCFRVSEAQFDAILGRIKAADIPYRSEVRGGARRGRGPHQHRVRRADDLLERAGRAPVGDAHGELRAAAGTVGL